MKSAFSLGWRLLLVLALAFNPVAAAFAMTADRDGAEDATALADVPPCHEMDPATGNPEPEAAHGCDCGNAACEFAACCGVGALVASVHFIAVEHARNHLLLSGPPDGALPPPPSRLIRPPIA